ncbi:MAG: spondin domain-containing protein [Acidimicrobiales bacterium]
MQSRNTANNRGRNRRRRSVGALALGTALLASACGSATAAQDTTAGDSAPALDSAAAQTTTTEAEAAAEAARTVRVTIENIASFPITDSGSFAVPVGGDEPGPALPGDAYTFNVAANAGDRLSFATMFVQSNDWFFAPDPAGIELFDADGQPIGGDVTDQIFVFDSGTEIDQTVGEGADQAPRQAGPDTGDDDTDMNVRLVDRSAADYISVLVEPGADGTFDVTIKNDSSMALVPTPLAPGVYAAHGPDATLFTVGAPDDGLGLEALAEDGDAAPLAASLATLTGTTTPLAPGAWAAHGEDVALYTLGSADVGLGLEALAEDGDPSALAEALGGIESVAAAGAFNTPVGASEPGPALPGDAYSFEATVADGQRLSFATMFVQSNDWIFATPSEGLTLDELNGDITDRLVVVDVGTEVDQRPGFGADQAPRQNGPDTGAADPDDQVRPVDGRSAGRYVRVTVEDIG